MPKDLLSNYSPYLRACFSGHLKEGIEGFLRLPDEEPKFFDVIVDYMKSHTTHLSAWRGTHIMQLKYDHKFLIFCDKYDILEAASAVAPDICGWLAATDNVQWDECVDEKLNKENPMYEATNNIWRDLFEGDGWSRVRVEKFWARQDEVVHRHVMMAVLALSANCGRKECAHHRCLWKNEERHLITSEEE